MPTRNELGKDGYHQFSLSTDNKITRREVKPHHHLDKPMHTANAPRTLKSTSPLRCAPLVLPGLSPLEVTVVGLLPADPLELVPVPVGLATLVGADCSASYRASRSATQNLNVKTRDAYQGEVPAGDGARAAGVGHPGSVLGLVEVAEGDFVLCVCGVGLDCADELVADAV